MSMQIETYKKKLPSSGEQLTIRPILVREEKLYIMGKESQQPTEFFDRLIQVVGNCTIEPKNFDVNEMSYQDFLYLFLELRKVSKGEKILLDVFCQNPECSDGEVEQETADGKKIKTKIPHVLKNVEFNLNQIIRIENENIKRPKIIKLSDTIGVEVKPTKVSYVRQLGLEDNKMSDALLKYDSIEKHLVAEIVGESRFAFVNSSDKEKYIEQLKEEHIEKIIEWKNQEPRCVVDFEWECDKCHNKNHVVDYQLLRFLEW